MGDFKNVFKRLRIASQLTQADMAQKLGIAKSTISMYENGNREPDFETLEKIADFFNVDTDYLLGRTEKTLSYRKPLATIISTTKPVRLLRKFLNSRIPKRKLRDIMDIIEARHLDIERKM